MAIFKTISSTILSSASTTMVTCKAHSAEIFLWLGFGGVLVGTGLACKAAIESSKIIEEEKKSLRPIPEKPEEAEGDEETTEEKFEELVDIAKRNNRKVYLRIVRKVFKKALPAIIIMGLSLASILQSNHIMKQRNLGLAAAYAAIDKAYTSYRQRVVDRFGEDVDKELAYGVKSESVETTYLDENGEVKTKKEIKYVSDLHEYGPYAVNFTEESDFYEASDTANTFVLNSAQSYFNSLLVIKKVVTLNEVLDKILGPTRGSKALRKAGMVVGWIYDPENNKEGDNSIVFNIFRVTRKNQFGYEEEQIIVDFNVDGMIYNKI